MRTRRGFTLAELTVVLLILVAVAALAIPTLRQESDDARLAVTNANLAQLRNTILSMYRLDENKRLPRPGSFGLSVGRPDRAQLRYLFVNPDTESAGAPASTIGTFDPVTKFGWRGPYLMAGAGVYAQDSDWNGDTSKAWLISGFTADFGKTGDPTVLDGWNNPIVIVESVVAGVPHAELRSAGPPATRQNGKPVFDLTSAARIVLPLY